MTMTNLSQGFASVKVGINAIENNVAFCNDRRGRQYKVGANYMVGSGALPQVGEEWLIDRTLGYWTFSSRLSANPPTATESIPSILQALAQTGLVQTQQGTTSASGASVSAGYLFNSVTG